MKTNYGPIASMRYGKSTPVALDAVRLTSGVLSDWALRNRESISRCPIALRAAATARDALIRESIE